MKNIPRKIHNQFIADADALFTRLGFQPMPEGALYADSLRIMTDYGIFIVHPPTDIFYPEKLLDINGRFQDASHGVPSDDVNPYSGKWNIISSDPEQLLAEFARRMASVNAHAPTPEEQAAWDIADRIAAADLAAKRAEWKAWDAGQALRLTA